MSIESIELWAAAKIIGRECASINKAYFMCKKEKGSPVHHDKIIIYF
jgi:hypothetical protein